MMMAITHAKTGRSRRKFDNTTLLRYFDSASGLLVFTDSRRLSAVEWLNFHGDTRPYIQHALNDQSLTDRQARCDKPFVADGPIDRELPLLDLPVSSTIIAMGSPFGLRLTLCWGTRRACWATPSSTMARTNIPGRRIYRIREHDPQRVRACGRVHCDVAEL